MSDGVEDAVEGIPELHGFGGSVSLGAGVDGGPAPVPGVVAEQSRFALAFFLDGGRREHDVFEVSYQFVGQDHPEAVFEESCHFISDEVGVFVGGVVASAADTLVLLFESPWFGLADSRYSFVSPLS